MRLRVLRAPHFILLRPLQGFFLSALWRVPIHRKVLRFRPSLWVGSCVRLLCVCVESGTLGLADNAQFSERGSPHRAIHAHGENDGLAGITAPTPQGRCAVSPEPNSVARSVVNVRMNGLVAEHAVGNGAQAPTPLNGSSSLSSASGSSVLMWWSSTMR